MCVHKKNSIKGQKIESTFHKGKYTDGEWLLRYTSAIDSLQRNTNLKHSQIPLIYSEERITLKRLTIPYIGANMEHPKLLSTPSGRVK